MNKIIAAAVLLVAPMAAHGATAGSRQSGGAGAVSQVRLANGTVTLPSLRFRTDSDTGLYLPASNTLGFTAGGLGDMFYYKNDSAGAGFLGIGTSAPAAPLHIRGAGGKVLRVESTNSWSDLQMFSLTGANPIISFHVDSVRKWGIFPETLNANTLYFYAEDADTKMSITQTGRVGIGTTTPATKLHMSSGVFTLDGTGPGITVGVSTFVVVNGQVGIGTSSPSASLQIVGGRLVVPTGSSSSPSITFSSSGLYEDTSPSGALTVTRAGTEVLTVDTNQVLTRAGTVALPGIAGLADTNTGISFLGSDVLAASTAGAERLRINAGGLVGIGNTSPATKLHMSSGVFTLDGSDPGITVGVSTFVVTGGKVGIGTSAPATKVHVSSGVVTIDGSGAGLVLGTASDTALTRIITASASLNYGATAAGTCDSLTITATGAVDGDTVYLGLPNALAASDTYQAFYGFVSAADTVTVRRCNLTNATTALNDPAAATVKVRIVQ
jgi:hypothetical protein